MPGYGQRGGSGRRASLGLSRFFGGDATEGGTFDELPSVSIDEPQGPTATGEPLRPRVKLNPGKFTPAKASGWDPFGTKADRAAQINMQGGQTTQQIAAQMALAQANEEAAYTRQGMTGANNLAVQQLQNSGQLANTVQGGRNAIDLANTQGNIAFTGKYGAAPSALSALAQSTTPHIVTRAELETGNAARFAAEPQGIESQRVNYNAQLRAPAAENYSKLKTPLQANEDVLLPGGYSGLEDTPTMLSGPRAKQTVQKTMHDIVDPTTGKPIMSVPGQDKVTTEYQEGPAPRQIISQQERARREAARLKSIQDAQANAPAIQDPDPIPLDPTGGPRLQAKPNLGSGQATFLSTLLQALMNTSQGSAQPTQPLYPQRFGGY